MVRRVKGDAFAESICSAVVEKRRTAQNMLAFRIFVNFTAILFGAAEGPVEPLNSGDETAAHLLVFISNFAHAQ